ncbi:MAG: family 43 glycosylhydrolase [Chitinophagaceae bacterium]
MKKLVIVTLSLLSLANSHGQKNKNPYKGYLFAYFTGNQKEEEAIRFAVSTDGYRFRALNDNQPIIASATISETGGIRDPHILRGEDGKTFYMVATDMVSAKGWNSNRGLVLMKSSDLIHWTSTALNIQKRYPGEEDLQRVWAPQTVYDHKAGKYMVYFSMQNGKQEDILYYAYANKDFTGFEARPQQLFFPKDGKACIDPDIIYKDGKYHLFYKTENTDKGIHLAISDDVNGGYASTGGALQSCPDQVEGSSVFKLNDDPGYILMYDRYTTGKFQFTYTKDFKQFTVVDDKVSLDFHARHGSVISLTEAEIKRLETQWLTAKDIVKTIQSPVVKKNNIDFSEKGDSVFLPVAPNTDLKQLNPDFESFPFVQYKPKGAVDFSNGAVNYTFIIGGKKQQIKIAAVPSKNPILNGFYADPEVLYSHKTNKYYIYPTSDGFTGWSGNYFKTFSSHNLVDWKDEGTILQLGKDVQWANRNAWAPCIEEKKIGNDYKYFYYFAAAQKIGVAVADNPTGPFTDKGSPIIDQYPKGVTHGQQIDPDVFTDPATNKSYLYWGNGYMAGAELNNDMLSVKDNTVKLMTPDRTFREGTYVFYRNGKYYVLWSEDDTRSPDYQVRYGIASDPLGKIEIPANNIVLRKDPSLGIYGTGHNSVLQVPGKDEWYIVYHRFNRPNGIKMGDAAGYNREVCIDRLLFNADGTIKEVVPTL